jgi:hypothetical protein
MTRRTQVLATLAPVLLCVTGLGVAYILQPPPHPTACDEELQSLLLDVGELPEGSLMAAPNRTPSIGVDSGGGRGACQTEYSVVAGHAIHIVYRFEDELRSAAAYRQLTDAGLFDRHGVDLPWREEESLSEALLRADEGHALCSPRIGNSPRCAAVARYGTYVSLFEIEMNAASMTVSDFGRILSAIGEPFTRLREKEN